MNKLKLRHEYVKDMKSIAGQLGKSLKTEIELRKIYKTEPSEAIFNQIKIAISLQKKLEKQLNTSTNLYGSTFGFIEANNRGYEETDI